MKNDAFPITPEMRMVESHKIGDIEITIFEMPEIDVDEPYIVVVKSQSLDFGIGESRIPCVGKVMARSVVADAITKYCSMASTEHLRPGLELVCTLLLGKHAL